jgi:hypothetical protein
MLREAGEVGVQPDAQQGIVAAPGGIQFIDEFHGGPSSLFANPIL